MTTALNAKAAGDKILFEVQGFKFYCTPRQYMPLGVKLFYLQSKPKKLKAFYEEWLQNPTLPQRTVEETMNSGIQNRVG